jgi:hypothetical protein
VEKETALISAGTLAAEQIDAAFRAHNPAAPPIGGAIVSDAAASGVNGDFVAAEIAVETGWWTSDRATRANNPSGLGATDDGAWGQTFDTPAAGIRATFAHWLSYIYGAANTWSAYDPRWGAVQTSPHFGRARVVGDVGNGLWATDPAYADTILRVAAEMGAGDPAPAQTGGTMEISDIRDQLPTNPGGGSGQTMGAIRGAVIHYSAVDYPGDRPMMDILVSEANFHIGPYLGEAGLAYHYSIDPQTGDLYQCRDEDALLWHCGAWSNATAQGLGNDNALAIHVPGGPSLVMSDAALARLVAFLDAKSAEHGFGREAVVGHKELSSTACPGPLMDQLVLPYRAGALHGEAGTSAPVEPPAHDAYAFTDDVTGQYCGGAFARIYQTRGGLYIFGRVLSREMDEACGDGVTRTVQYFERMVFEFHPEYQGTDYEVLLRRLGAEEAAAKGLTGPGIAA